MDEKEIKIIPEIDESEIQVEQENIIINTSGTSDYNELINKPQINNIELIGNKMLDELGIQEKGDYALTSDIPTSTSELINDSGYITEEQDPTVPNHVKNITQGNITSWNNKSEFSGNYNDLTNKPTIPTSTSDLTNDSGFITNEVDPTVPSHVKSITQQNITSWNNKQDTLTAGENITIENNVISATTGGGGTLPYKVYYYEHTFSNYGGSDTSEEASALLSQIKSDLESGNKVMIIVNLTIQQFSNYKRTLIGFPTLESLYIEFNLSPVYFTTGSGSRDMLAPRIRGQISGQFMIRMDAYAFTGYIVPLSLSYDNANKGEQVLTLNNTSSYTPTANYNPSTKLYTDKTHYENMAGYDASKTQVLKNVQGVLTWETIE